MHHEEVASKSWPNQWGFLTTKYEDVSNNGHYILLKHLCNVCLSSSCVSAMCKYIACSNLKDVIVNTKGMQQQEFFVQYACMLSTEDVILLSPCIDGIFNFPSVCRSMCPKIFFGYFLRYGLESNFTIWRVVSPLIFKKTDCYS